MAADCTHRSWSLWAALMRLHSASRGLLLALPDTQMLNQCGHLPCTSASCTGPRGHRPQRAPRSLGTALSPLWVGAHMASQAPCGRSMTPTGGQGRKATKHRARTQAEPQRGARPSLTSQSEMNEWYFCRPTFPSPLAGLGFCSQLSPSVPCRLPSLTPHLRPLPGQPRPQDMAVLPLPWLTPLHVGTRSRSLEELPLSGQCPQGAATCWEVRGLGLGSPSSLYKGKWAEASTAPPLTAECPKATSRRPLGMQGPSRAQASCRQSVRSGRLHQQVVPSAPATGPGVLQVSTPRPPGNMGCQQQ